MTIVLAVLFINKPQSNTVVCAGRQYDDFGSAYVWWSSETDAKFGDRAQCFVDQYNSFKLPELNKTVSESSVCINCSWYCSSETCKLSVICVAGERRRDTAGKHCWQWRCQGGFQGLQEAYGAARMGCLNAPTARTGAILTGPAFLHRLRHGIVVDWEPVDSQFDVVCTVHHLTLCI
jgi:hypothetical protein